MAKYKVAIISCGMISNNAHIPAYKNFPDYYEIAAVCDVFEKAAAETAKRHGIDKYYTDSEKMLNEIKPDIVSVCVPNNYHKETVITALNHNCHVLCEKPVAVKLSDAEEMYALAKEKGKLLVACQSMRFTPDRLAAKKFIDEGKLGNVIYAEFSRIRRRGIPFWGTFHLKEANGGGAFIDIGVHMLDALVWLLGTSDVKSVSATSSLNFADYKCAPEDSGAPGGVFTGKRFSPEEMTSEDFLAGSISFKNNIRVNFKVAWATNMPNTSSITIAGKKAGLNIDGSLVSYTDRNTDTILKLPEEKFRGQNFSGHFHLIENIYNVLEGKEELIIKPEETLAVTAVIEAIYLSAELGREVSIDEIR